MALPPEILPLFRGDNKCPKCGTLEATFRYYEANASVPTDFMYRGCKGCGYGWREACLDHPDYRDVLLVPNTALLNKQPVIQFDEDCAVCNAISLVSYEYGLNRDVLLNKNERIKTEEVVDARRVLIGMIARMDYRELELCYPHNSPSRDTNKFHFSYAYIARVVGLDTTVMSHLEKIGANLVLSHEVDRMLKLLTDNLKNKK